MAKYVCAICGYVHEGDSAPEACPLCKAPASKFSVMAGERVWAAEHVVGVAHVRSPAITLNLLAGALHSGHDSGALSPSWT